MRRLALVLLGTTFVMAWCCKSVSADGWLPFLSIEEESKYSRPPSTAASLGIDRPPSQATDDASAPPRTAAPGATTPLSKATTQRPTQSLQKATAAEDTPWYARSPFSGAHAPKSPFTSSKGPAAPPRNGWVAPKEEPKPKGFFYPWQAVTSGSRHVANGTKSAWRKTVDVLTPGDPAPQKPQTRVAQREEPSLWSRMTGGADEAKQPRTVPEWMSQERLKP